MTKHQWAACEWRGSTAGPQLTLQVLNLWSVRNLHFYLMRSWPKQKTFGWWTTRWEMLAYMTSGRPNPAGHPWMRKQEAFRWENIFREQLEQLAFLEDHLYEEHRLFADPTYTVCTMCGGHGRGGLASWRLPAIYWRCRTKKQGHNLLHDMDFVSEDGSSSRCLQLLCWPKETRNNIRD